MEFKTFADQVAQRLTVLSQTGKLFKSSLTGNELWDIYIKSFRPDDNPVFRDPESSTHNCNLDKNFIRRYGNIVSIVDNEVITLWDIDIPKESEYFFPATKMSELLKSAKVEDVFFETFSDLNDLNYEKCKKNNPSFRLGIQNNHKIYTQEEADKFGRVVAGQVYQFNHYYGDIPSVFVDNSGQSQASLIAAYRDSKNVFQRGMQEIPSDTLELVRDLIAQGSLLDGSSHLYKIEAILPLKKEYDSLSLEEKDAWCWVNSYKLPFAKFRNELIGTLCVELAEGVELNKSCETWNKRVDPANYMKAKAPITQNQVNEARKFVEENGYEESFNRRFASIYDINVNEIAHSNIGKGDIKTASIFDKVQSASTRHKRSEFSGVEEVSIEKFMKDILPGCTSVETFVENRMQGNFVALTTSVAESKPIFKWDNPFSWTFNGNLAGKSQIKEAVKTAGGKVDGVLRFSIMWADGDGDNSDLDAHCHTPTGDIIYHACRVDYLTNGNLDVDITRPNGKLAVENIVFPVLSKMVNGAYRFVVNQFEARGSRGFKAEIEFDGQSYSYEFNKPVDSRVSVADVTLINGLMEIKHHLPESTFSKTIWGVNTNHFNKVNLVCLSPNHWGENNIGNKHYLFMLDGCKSDISLRSFHNENLNADLLYHRKVMEVLGATSMLNPTDKQLAGLGFNSTVSDELVVKLQGTHKRTIKLKFN